MTRKLLPLLVCLALLVGTAVGCGPSKKAELTKIRLTEVIRSVFYTPMYVAISKGFYKDAGLDIDFSTAWGTDKGTAALLSGSVDIALIGPEGAIYTHQQGAQNPVQIFAQLTNKDGSFLVARQKTDNFQWSDIKGKTVLGNRPGGMPEMVAEWVYKRNGVDPEKDVTIIKNIALNAMVGAFKGGLGDYCQVFEPLASQLEQDGAGYVVASFGQAAGPMPYTCFEATEKYIKDHPDIIQAFADATLRGMLWTKENSAENVAAAIQMFFPDTPKEILISVVERYKKYDTWAPDPILRPEAFDLVQEIMIAGSILTEKQPYDKCAVTRFAENAVKRIKKP